MRILVVGWGGREHALAWKISRSPLVRKLFCAPGNPGIAQVAELVPVTITDVEALVREARLRRVDLVVVGPEAPLVLGLADRLGSEGIPVFGPSAAAAEIEGSKAFAKEVMLAAGIPTAEHATFADLEPAVAFADGERVRLLPAAQDHKRVGDGDRGPNTGGMGAFSPTPKVTREVAREVEEQVLLPALRELSRRGRPFRGALYAGLMMTPRGLRVLEFNARLGDPETQPILMRLDGDIVPALLAAAQGDLSKAEIAVDPRAAVGVVLAAEGYPAKPVAGDAIEGAGGPFEEGVQVFHAGTALAPDGRTVAVGGRVLTGCALGADLAAARERAYAAVGPIRLRGSHYRKDIGLT